jgi:aryl sulfotransferase
MICAVLVFGSPRLPKPLYEISPWLDWLVTPAKEVFSRLEAQDHRRIIKTHTPLDGIGLLPEVTYLVVGRDPLDMAVSLYNQGGNIDRARVRRLIEAGASSDSGSLPKQKSTESLEGPAAARDWLLRWIRWEPDPIEHLDSLPGVLMHLSHAWSWRRHENVILLHYDELRSNLEGEMKRLAAQLGLHVESSKWPSLVEACSFEAMRSRASELVGQSGTLVEPLRFFRRGSSGEGRELLSPEELRDYRVRVARMARSDLVSWLHRDGVPDPSAVSPQRS